MILGVIHSDELVDFFQNNYININNLYRMISINSVKYDIKSFLKSWCLEWQKHYHLHEGKIYTFLNMNYYCITYSSRLYLLHINHLMTFPHLQLCTMCIHLNILRTVTSHRVIIIYSKISKDHMNETLSWIIQVIWINLSISSITAFLMTE